LALSRLISLSHQVSGSRMAPSFGANRAAESAKVHADPSIMAIRAHSLGSVFS